MAEASGLGPEGWGFDSLQGHQFEDIMSKICSAPWNTVAVVPGGDVYSCLCGAWTDRVIGNLQTQSLTEIYKNSVMLDQLKSSVLDGSYRFCRADMCPNLHNLETAPVGVYQDQLQQPILPTTVMLGIDENCNLKCPSCRNQRVYSKTMNSTVRNILSNLQQSYRDFDQPVQVFCDGAGDLFTSEAYNQFLFNGELPNCFKLVVTTNGNLLKKKMQKILSIADRFQSFIVSLDAATAETYAITRGGDFDIVLQGVEQLKQHGFKVNFQFVLQRANYHELAQYRELANRLQVPYGVQLLHRWPHMSETYWLENSITPDSNIDTLSLRQQLDYLNNDITCTFNGGVISLYNQLI